MKKAFPVLTLTACVLAASVANATSVFIQGGLHFGGDELARVTFIDGETESIDAGGLISASVGLIADINEMLELRTSLGIKFDLISASNGDLDFTRFPLDIMLFSKGEAVRLGAGISYHIDPQYSASGLGINSDIDFDDALGFAAQLEYRLGERGHLGIRATVIDYDTSSSFGSASFSGNSIGIIIGARF